MKNIEELNQLLKNTNKQKTKIEVALNTNATEELLNELYEKNSDNLAIVEAIASNENVSSETLTKIANGELTSSIVNNILENASTNNHVRKILKRNEEIKEVMKYETVLKEIGKNASVEDCYEMKTKEKLYTALYSSNEDVLNTLSEDKNMKIKLAVARNENLTTYLIEKMVYTDDLNILDCLLLNKNASENSLERILMNYILFLSKNEITEGEQNYYIIRFKKLYFHENTTFDLSIKIIESMKNVKETSLKCFYYVLLGTSYNVNSCKDDIYRDEKESILLKRRLREILIEVNERIEGPIEDFINRKMANTFDINFDVLKNLRYI